MGSRIIKIITAADGLKIRKCPGEDSSELCLYYKDVPIIMTAHRGVAIHMVKLVEGPDGVSIECKIPILRASREYQYVYYGLWKTEEEALAWLQKPNDIYEGG